MSFPKTSASIEPFWNPFRGSQGLEPIPRISRTVGASSKKDKLANPPSRSGIPKTRGGKGKKKAIVEAAVLLGQELTNSRKSEPLTLLSFAKQDQTPGEINENTSRKVHSLVPRPKGTRILGGKWV